MIVFLSSTPLLYFLIVYQYAMHFSGSIPAKRDTDWRTLLSVKGVPCEWLEVEVPEERFVLGVVLLHHIYFNDFGNSSPIFFSTSMNLSFISFSLKYSSETKFRRAIGCFELLNTSMTA